MARTTSIFYNLQNYKDELPKSSRYHLDEVEDANYQPRAFKDRISRLAIEIKSARSITTTLENLFIVLNLRLEDLQKLPTLELYKKMRALLKKQANIEIAPPGNPVSIEPESKFKITPVYVLNNDPDIVAAMELNGLDRMNSLLKSRIQKATEKINNFVIMLHVFEALSLVTINGELNIDQRSLINQLIENSTFPAEGKQYLQTCFTQVIDNQVRENVLTDEGCAIKEIKDKAVLKDFLVVLTKLAVLARGKPDFKNYKYADLLSHYYELNKVTADTTVARKKFSHIHNAEDLFVAPLEILKPLEIARNLFVLFKQEHPYAKKPAALAKYKAEVKLIATQAGFYNPTKMKFNSTNSVVYIDNIIVNDSNIYTTTVTEQEYSNIGFAVNTNSFRCSDPNKENKYFSNLDNAQRRRFAILLQHPNDTNYVNSISAEFIAANLAYRIFVEGYLDLITDKERQVAFMWLMQWYNILYNVDDNAMHYLNNALQSIGTYISIYALLYPEDITPEQSKIISTQKYFKVYAQFSLALKIKEKSSTLENCFDNLFSLFIATNSTYNNKIRAPGINSTLLYSNAKKIFREYFYEHQVQFKHYLENLQVTTGPEYKYFDTGFAGLTYYLNYVVCAALPGIIALDEANNLCSKAISYIDNKQKALLQYILKGNVNTRNDIIFRILELDNSNSTKSLPKSICVIKNNLLEMNIAAYEKIKQMVNLNLANRLNCTNILEQCSKVIGLTMIPNSAFESIHTTVSTYNYVLFTESKLITNSRFPSFIIPFRLALDCATSYTAMDYLLTAFKANVSAFAKDFTPEEFQSLVEYASIITNIKQQKGGSFHASFVLKNITTDEYFTNSIEQYLSIILNQCEKNITLRNIKALAHYLPLEEINKFTSFNYNTAKIKSYGSYGTTSFEANSDPKKLDMNLISRKTKETAEVQQLLAPIFVAEETLPERVAEAPSDLSDVLDKEGNISGIAVFKQLPENCQKLLKRLLQIREFTSEDFRKLCAEEGLMSSGAMEIINNWALEQFECTLIEEDEPMFFDRDLLSELLQ